MILCADVLLGLFVLLALDADNWSKNADAALSLLHSPFKLVPRIQASNAGCIRFLPRNLQNVAKALCHLSDYVERMPLDRRKARGSCRCALRRLT